MKKISVIVPIYNAEKYLDRCIKSILNQTYKNIELILVNDGSTDDSESIATKYSTLYKNRVLYLEKQNGGLSDARNFGLKYATGDYYAFVDSDDYIENTLFENTAKYMNEDYDMIKFQIIDVDEDEKEISRNHSVIFEDKTGEEAFEILFKEDNMTEVAWGYLYKADFWKENKFEYAKDRYHEDFGLTPLILLKAKKVASTKILAYYYVHTSNSMVRDNNQKAIIRANDLIYHYDYMIRKIDNYDITEKSKGNIKQYYTNSIILAVKNLHNHKEQEEYIAKIKERKMIRNIKATNLKQAVKKIILAIDIRLYLKFKK